MDRVLEYVKTVVNSEMNVELMKPYTWEEVDTIKTNGASKVSRFRWDASPLLLDFLV